MLRPHVVQNPRARVPGSLLGANPSLTSEFGVGAGRGVIMTVAICVACAVECTTFGASNSAFALSPSEQAVPTPAATPPATQQTPERAPKIESYPDDPRLDSAVKMLTRGGFDIAEMTARTVLRTNDNVDRAAAVLGVALVKQKRYEEAKPFLTRARDSAQPFPERKHAAHFLGWALFHLGELAPAREAFEAHLKLVPNEPDSTFGLGLVAFGEDRLDDADRHFEAALQGFANRAAPQPNDQAKVLVRMSDVAVRRENLPKAEELLQQALRLNTTQHEAWLKLARVSDRLGKRYEADIFRANADRILKARGQKPVDDESSTLPVPGATAPAAPTTPAAPTAPAGSGSSTTEQKP